MTDVEQIEVFLAGEKEEYRMQIAAPQRVQDRKSVV